MPMIYKYLRFNGYPTSGHVVRDVLFYCVEIELPVIENMAFVFEMSIISCIISYTPQPYFLGLPAS